MPAVVPPPENMDAVPEQQPQQQQQAFRADQGEEASRRGGGWVGWRRHRGLPAGVLYELRRSCGGHVVVAGQQAWHGKVGVEGAGCT